MAEVEFHTGVADPFEFACRLLRKACRQGVRVLVTASAADLPELDRRLWTFDEREFVPHVRVPGPPSATLALTPVWLATGLSALEAVAGDAERPQVIVNLGADAPPAAIPWRRLVEIVSSEPEAAAAGRARWRAYRAAGLEIRHHAAADSG